MPNKVLFCGAVADELNTYLYQNIQWFKKSGWEVHVAIPEPIDSPYIDHKYTIEIQDSIFDRLNLEAYHLLRVIIEVNNYSIIHCYTKTGGILTRLAARRARKHGATIFYTDSGFTFFKGASFKKWLFDYPIEKLLSKSTDNLITTTLEDYHFANHHLKAKNIEHVHGVGIDIDQFKPLVTETRLEWKRSRGYQLGEFLVFCIVDSKRSDHQEFLYQALASIKGELPNLRLVIMIENSRKERWYHKAEEYGVGHLISLLDYQEKNLETAAICDVVVSMGCYEGLPVHLMKAMACGLPVISSNSRGCREIVKNNKNGWRIDFDDLEVFSNKLTMLVQLPELRKKLGDNARAKILKNYSCNKVHAEMKRIYQPYVTTKTTSNKATNL